MKYQYTVNGDNYTLPEEEVEGFLETFPNAQKTEPGKTNPSQETKDARVEEDNTASNSENGFSEPTLEDQKTKPEFPRPIGYTGEKVIISKDGSNVVNPLDETLDLPITLQNKFVANTKELFNNNLSTKDISKAFKNTIIPKNYVLNLLNYAYSEGKGEEIGEEKLKTEIGDKLKNYQNLSSEDKGEVFNKVISEAIKAGPNNPVGNIYQKELQKSYMLATDITRKQFEPELNNIKDQWLQSVNGAREQKLESVYGESLENLGVSQPNARTIYDEYKFLNAEKNKFFVNQIKNKELDKKSEEAWGLNYSNLVDNNSAVNEIQKSLVKSVHGSIVEKGRKLRLSEGEGGIFQDINILGFDINLFPEGYSDTPSIFETAAQVIEKTGAQVSSGYLNRIKIQPNERKLFEIRREFKKLQDLNDNDNITIRLDKVFSDPTSKTMPVSQAKKYLEDLQQPILQEQIKALQRDEELRMDMATYASGPSFAKEVDLDQDFISIMADILNPAAMAQSTIELGTQIATTAGVGMVFQEQGFSFKDQLDNTIKNNEEQINKYLIDNSIEDTALNKQIAAMELGLMSENSKLISDIVGGINGSLEMLPFGLLLKKVPKKAFKQKMAAYVSNTVKNIFKNKKNLAVVAGAEIGTELGQNVVTDFGSAIAEIDFMKLPSGMILADGKPVYSKESRAKLSKYIDLEQGAQEGIKVFQGILLPFTAGNMMTSDFMFATEKMDAKDKLTFIEKIKKEAKEQFDGGQIDEKTYNSRVKRIDEFEKLEKKIDPALKGDARIKVANLLELKQQKQKEKEGLDDSMQDRINNDIDGINQEIQEIVNTEFSAAPSSTTVVSEENKKIAIKNKDLIAIIKDPTLQEIINDPESTAIEKGQAQKKITDAEGELFIANQGLINDVVNKKFDPSKDSGLEKESLIAEANIEFLELIKTFTPEKGEFGSYARTYLNLRLNKSIAKLTGSQKNKETGKFEMAPKQDITEMEVGEVVAEESTQVLDEVGTKLKAEFGLEEETVGKIKEAVTKVFGTSLPAVTDKGFKKKVIKAFKDELTDLVKKDGIFGKDSSEFAAFLEDNAEAIYKSLPLEVMTKSFSQFTEKQIDPKTGKPFRERTEAGKEIFVKKDFNDVKDEFINYFTDRGLKSAARSDRKTSIATQIADQLARDEVVGVLSDPKVAEKFKAVQELEGKKVPEDYLDRIVRELDRGLEWLQKQQQSDTLRFSLVVPELAAKALELFLKTFIAALKNPKVQKTAKQVGKNTTALSIALKEAIKAVQNKYGNLEINPDIEKAIRNNVNRTREGIDINEEAVLSIFEDIFTGDMPTVMQLGKDKNGKKISLRSLFKNKDEVNKSIEVLENFVEKNKDRTDINIPELFYLLGQSTFGARGLYGGRRTLFNRKEAYFKWFKNTFPNFKTPKEKKYKTLPKVNKKFDFAEDKIRAADAMLFYKELAQFIIKNADKNQIAMILSTTTENKNSILKLAAPVLYYQDNLKKGTETSFEHLSPASYINTMMINKYYYNKNVDIDKILSDYAVAVIDENISKDLKANKLNAKQSDEYENGKNHPTKRIFNEKIKALGKYDGVIIRNLETGERFGFNEKIQQEKQSELGTEFNQIIEETKGIAADKEYSEAQGRNIGRKANKLKIFVPYSAEDLLGLLYRFAGEGKQGDAHLKWIKDNITTPLTESFIRFEVAQQSANIYLEEAKKLAAESGIDFTKEAVDGYTVDQAIRIHIWSNSGYDLEKLIGMKEDQVKRINTHIRQNFDIKTFESAIKDAYVNNDRKYPPPKDRTWISGTITTDLLNFTNSITRGEAFKSFFDNIESIFGAFDKEKGKLSGSNLNKIKAVYGTNFVKALESSLYRIHTGRNRSYKLDQQGDSILNWTNNAIGNIMFFNTRSAILQTLSNVNFTNWHDNNPIEVAKAWKNTGQFAKDFTFIFNSDYLKSRRSGLKTDINEQEIATAVNSTNKVEAMLATILKKGFLPTQMADSFAIALGGASFYRNRTNKYKNDGMSQEEAETQAFKDFREISEDSQQSSRPDKISMEQAGFAGRLILAFQNTPMQYNRLAKKAMLDLINRRGDTKTNVSKIIWYLGVQNAVFYASQQALFSIMFDTPETDDEEKREKQRYFNLVNGMADSIIRGSGVYGALISTSKNLIIEILKEGTKEEDVIKALSAISPPINKKVRQAFSISKKFIYQQELKKIKELGLDSKNPAILAGAEALSFGINLPADRALKKINNLRYAFEEETEWWQSVALALGWSPYDVNIDEFEKEESRVKTRGLKERSVKRKLKKRKIK